jgi:hypothetical protein
VPVSPVGSFPSSSRASHQVDELALELENLLARARSRRVDIAGKSERARAEVHRRNRLARHAELVDDMTDAGDVFKRQLRWVIRIDVRLRRAVDDQHEASRHEAIGLDHGQVAALFENHVRVFGHLSILAAGNPPNESPP